MVKFQLIYYTFMFEEKIIPRLFHDVTILNSNYKNIIFNMIQDDLSV